MKNLLSSLFFLFISTLAFAQKNGYKNICIGVYIDSLTKNYRIINSNTKNLFFIIPDSEKICGLKIEHIEIKVEKGYINEVSVFTKKINFNNYDEFWSQFKQTLNSVISTVGKSNFESSDRNFISFGWGFKEFNTVLVFRSDAVNSFDTNFKRSYLFIWAKNDENDNGKMW